MMMMSGGGGGGGGLGGGSGRPHGDVLDAAIPDDAAGRDRLLSELKDRGRRAVQAGVWPDAASLYERGIEVCEKDGNNNNKKELSILNSNLSLVLGKMNRWDDARDAAVKAVSHDPAYTKGWWRLGQAEGNRDANYDASVSALEKAVELEPDNKAIKKELDRMKQKQQQQRQQRKEEAENGGNNSATTTTATTTTTTTTTTATTTRKSSSKKNEDAGTAAETSGGGDFTKSDHVRGYKIVNGKKTSYFHNELSEDAAKLIGDIAPKRIDPGNNGGGGGDGGNGAAAAASSDRRSAWNEAGTWEERDVTKWCLSSLEEKLKNATYTFPESSPAPGAVVITATAKVDGHGSVAVVRNKKKYIYEISVKLNWNFDHPMHDGNSASGSMEFADVDGTCPVGEPYECTSFRIASCHERSLDPVLRRFVHKSGYRDAIHDAIDSWVNDFKEAY